MTSRPGQVTAQKNWTRQLSQFYLLRATEGLVGRGLSCRAEPDALPGPILQLVDDSLIIVARTAQLLDVLRGDVLLVLSGPLDQAKVRGRGVLELSFAPLLLALEVFDEVHYELVYPLWSVVTPSYT